MPGEGYASIISRWPNDSTGIRERQNIMDDRGDRISLIAEIIILIVFAVCAVHWVSDAKTGQQAYAYVNECEKTREIGDNK